MKFSKMYVFINFDKNTVKFKKKFWKSKKLTFCGLQLGHVSYLLVVAPVVQYLRKEYLHIESGQFFVCQG